jgi:hypothetical protein
MKKEGTNSVESERAGEHLGKEARGKKGRK